MFGKSYLLDMYGCKVGTCDDIELHYRFLEELVVRIGMTPMSPPFVIHAPARYRPQTKLKQDKEYTKEIYIGGDFPTYSNDIYDRIELYPDKAGCSAWQPLVESGLQIHSLEPSHFSSLDVYTCGKLDENLIREFAKKIFGFTSFEEHLINRGVNYAH
jgi:S-adenosylmethionine/arginine decarboxylase-like enzyme